MHCLSMLQLEDLRKNEDPRLSFATPEFKEAQRTFTEHFKVGHNTIDLHCISQEKSSFYSRAYSCTQSPERSSAVRLSAPSDVGV